MRTLLGACGIAAAIIVCHMPAAPAGDHAGCPPTAGGAAWCGPQCGPRYRGEIFEPSRPDPCDACGRWRGCNGLRESPDMLAPWQLPPGRGFQSAAQVGYDEGCGRCRSCGPRWPSLTGWASLSDWLPW